MPINYERDHLFATPGPSTTAKHGDPKGSDKTTVRTPSLDHQRLSADWADVEAVRAGTRTMRELGEAYLPMEPGEDPDAYNRRLGRATLTPIYTRLVRAFASQILRKPVRVANTGGLSEPEFRAIAGYKPGEDDTDAAVTGHLDDCDQEGSDLQQFAYDALCEAIHCGHAGIEIIYPNTEGLATLADQQAQGIRPYWSLYPGPRILAERHTTTNGLKKRTQVRLLQSVTVADGEWGEKDVEQVLVYGVGMATREDGSESRSVSYQIWQEDPEKEGEWLMVEAGPIDMDGLTELPFVFIHSDRRGHKTSPPMIEVLHLNIRHYQISADMDNSLHVAAVPRLFFFGCSPEDLGSVGSVNEAVCLPNPEARAEWVTLSPDAFKPNFERLQSIASEMMQLGLSTMTSQKNVGESAEAKRLDRSQGDSQLSILAQNLQQALDGALKLHCAYMGIDPAKAPTTTVNRDFDLTAMDAQFLSALTGVVNAGKLSTETFLGLLQHGEIGLPDDWTPAAEMERLDGEFTQQTERPAVPNGILEGALPKPVAVAEDEGDEED
ncbi:MULTISPECIES: DUF4055 domain-containing protein [Cyanophyceae]|uniref:DUF4055 domain-containing protein n=1 Tax=Cyanophyceae TaxID=3028117 RepID=UPI0016883B78|nr:MULTISPECIES: DUF4055 domain-containing protein [Cyanophyceae]MBD1918868.1 DUF4055 domain-containing protein [Phormidium sp. FACHB-77]MBD2033290.1 DUF4055 domain-containing protein [Phormidium sp. FACHB-322]MBD2053777.1 DUF4055 domain-containing protein [Leptolyngbya sp. FACHB-60]